MHDNFCIEELWSGSCTEKEARAVEQHMMDKHDTRVYPRPTNGVTKDIDLFRGGPPLQLNIKRSCKEVAMVEAAAIRVAKDMAIVSVRSRSETLAVQNRLQELMVVAMERVECTALAKIRRHTAALSAMVVGKPDAHIGVTEIHQYLNDIFTASSEDDGRCLRDLLLSKLMWYNVDKRGEDYTCPASVVLAELSTLTSALGLPSPSPSGPSITGKAVTSLLTPMPFETPEEALRHLVQTLVDGVDFNATGSVVKLQALSHPDPLPLCMEFTQHMCQTHELLDTQNIKFLCATGRGKAHQSTV